MASPTEHADANALLQDLLDRVKRHFAEDLVGVYLYGSAVAGDFHPRWSDVDLLIACSCEVETHLGALAELHADLVRAHLRWDDRIDLIYAPVEALRDLRKRARRIAFVSPGEPLHMRETGEVWVVNGHLIREMGVELFGPSPRELIAETTVEDFVSAVRAHLRGWPVWITESPKPGFHAYAVLTICRALHAIRTGAQLSKPRAARWAAGEYPQWSSLIGDALAFRESREDRGLGPRAALFIDFALRETRS